MGITYRYLKLGIILVTFISLSGCAFTVDKVPINYQFQEKIDTDVKYSKITQIGHITDMRTVENPKFIAHKRNMYGPTTGGYEAEKPIAEIIQDALAQGFVAANLPMSNMNNDYTLCGELLDYNYEVVMGIWDGIINSKLTVKLKLIDNTQDKTIWNETYMGKASIKNWNLVVKDPFSHALTDLVRQVCTDEFLLDHLK